MMWLVAIEIMDRRYLRDEVTDWTENVLPWTITGGATGGLGVRTSPLFENMGLVIRQNLHRNRDGGVGVEELRA